MKISRAVLWLAFLVAVAPGLRAGDTPFEVRAVAPHPGLTGNEYVLDDGGGDPVTLSLGSEVLLDTTALASAEAKEGEPGQWFIAVELTAEGKTRFGEVTTRFEGRRLAILVKGKVRCAPIINAPILDGSFEINGAFTEDEVKALAADLNAAAASRKAPANSAPAATATPGSP